MTPYDTSMKSTPTVLETNGTEREARRLHSMTITSEPLARNCAVSTASPQSLLNQVENRSVSVDQGDDRDDGGLC